MEGSKGNLVPPGQGQEKTQARLLCTAPRQHIFWQVPGGFEPAHRMSVSPHSPDPTQLRTERDFEDVGSTDSANSPLRCGVQIQNDFSHNPQTLVPLNQVPGWQRHFKGTSGHLLSETQRHTRKRPCRVPCEDEGLLASGWWGRGGTHGAGGGGGHQLQGARGTGLATRGSRR